MMHKVVVKAGEVMEIMMEVMETKATMVEVIMETEEATAVVSIITVAEEVVIAEEVAVGITIIHKKESTMMLRRILMAGDLVVSRKIRITIIIQNRNHRTSNNHSNRALGAIEASEVEISLKTPTIASINLSSKEVVAPANHNKCNISKSLKIWATVCSLHLAAHQTPFSLQIFPQTTLKNK